MSEVENTILRSQASRFLYGMQTNNLMANNLTTNLTTINLTANNQTIYNQKSYIRKTRMSLDVGNMSLVYLVNFCYCGAVATHRQ